MPDFEAWEPKFIPYRPLGQFADPEITRHYEHELFRDSAASQWRRQPHHSGKSSDSYSRESVEVPTWKYRPREQPFVSNSRTGNSDSGEEEEVP